MVLFSMTMSAAALESKTIFRQSENAATASWSNATSDGTIITDLSVTKTKDGTDIFIRICKMDLTGNLTCKFGFNTNQQDVFSISNKLTIATLSPVEISLFSQPPPPPPSPLSSDTVETITIQAQWTGVGDLIKGSSKSMSKSGEVIEKFSDTSTMRQATATGSINGTDLGRSDFANLVEFKSASMTMQK